MPNGDLDLADIDFSKPIDPGFIPEIVEPEGSCTDKDIDPDG